MIGYRDLQAFVCETSDDASLLMNRLRVDQKLKRINVVTAPRECKATDMRTPQLGKQLEKFLVKFVSDSFEAPKPIKDYLVSSKNLHKVLAKISTLGGKT